ncbi:helix-turn-helix domain-containing protein [Achromobacter sp. GG226]|uniref:helix-turn-helix domain-containing protein n=1 Tax=Verticiella alkaliphila TaxID=2779529 RepID=UPI001C0CD1CB|nr:helix-turn-helix domain-containing protein [Verticiella sp. GG226]MBU4612964.1 helix-turn-helix domain-containing protein [Verticiella sp. GG226]
MHPVPTYALYGEQPARVLPEPLHCESIPSRSRLHGWEIREHRHPHFLQILYIAAGSGRARMATAEVTLQAPCILVVPAGVAHGFQFSEDIDGFVFTAVQASVPPGVLAAFVEPVFHDLAHAGAPREDVAHAVHMLMSAWGAPPQPWRQAALLAGLTLVLVQLAAARARAHVQAVITTTRAHHHAERFRILVERHFREHRSIDDYAGRLGITPTQLNRVCREVLGHSALTVIQRRLLAEAERELAFTTLSVKEVALTLGFADAAYFSRFFVRHAGQTPTAYRRAARQSLSEQAPPAQG